jgi:hypothetical protein
MESIPGSNSFDKNQHMKRYSLSDAIRDGTLVFIASTFQAENERIVMGIDSPGPKVVDFGHLLKTDLIPFNQLMKELLKRCQDLFVSAVEMEFAMTFPYPKATPARFALLQVRPMSVTRAQVDVSPDELLSENVLLASESTLGNAVIETIRDIVYLKPRAFDASRTREAVSDIEAINRNLISKKVHYVLIGFGRWGTSDPSAGIPVNFEQISGASVIVESTLAQMNFFLSQGAHLFHDIIRLKVLYFSVSHTSKQRIDWEWLDGQEASSETELVRHVRLESPLMVKVDGRSGRGVIIR